MGSLNFNVNVIISIGVIISIYFIFRGKINESMSGPFFEPGGFNLTENGKKAITIIVVQILLNWFVWYEFNLFWVHWSGMFYFWTNLFFFIFCLIGIGIFSSVIKPWIGWIGVAMVVFLTTQKPVVAIVDANKEKAKLEQSIKDENDFPKSSKGEWKHATKDKPLKAYLDPKTTHIRCMGDAKYVFVEDTTIFFIDRTHSGDTPDASWDKKPDGKYLIYPEGKKDNITCKWDE